MPLLELTLHTPHDVAHLSEGKTVSSIKQLARAKTATTNAPSILPTLSSNDAQTVVGGVKAGPRRYRLFLPSELKGNFAGGDLALAEQNEDSAPSAVVAQRRLDTFRDAWVAQNSQGGLSQQVKNAGEVMQGAFVPPLEALLAVDALNQEPLAKLGVKFGEIGLNTCFGRCAKPSENQLGGLAVLIELDHDGSGQPVVSRIVESSGHTDFDHAALQAVAAAQHQQWAKDLNDDRLARWSRWTFEARAYRFKKYDYFDPTWTPPGEVIKEDLLHTTNVIRTVRLIAVRYQPTSTATAP